VYCSLKCPKEAWPEHEPIFKAFKAVGQVVTYPKKVVSKLNMYMQQLHRLPRPS
jgi:hypothetical protein